MLDLLKLMKERRTIHQFMPGAVDKNQMDLVIESARYVPNHRLTRPLRIIHLGPVKKEELICAQPEDEKREKLRSQLFGGGETLVLVQKCAVDDFTRKEDYATMACAVQNMSLMAQSLGLGSKWGTGLVTRDPNTYQILGLDQKLFEIVGFYYLGKPSKIPAPPKFLERGEYFLETE